MSYPTSQETQTLHDYVQTGRPRWRPSFYSITDRISHAAGVVGQIMHALMYFCVASLAYQAARVLGAFADGRVMLTF